MPCFFRSKNNIYAAPLLCYHRVMAQKRLIISAVLLKGFTSIIVQTLLIRELFIVFFGNELTFSVILAIWLLSSAFGSGIVANFFKEAKNPIRLYCFFQLILSASVPASIAAIRCSRPILGIPFGEAFTFGNTIAATAIGLGSTALLDGSMFTIAFRLATRIIDEKQSAMAKVYFLESLGLIIGGITFTFAMLSFFNSFQIAFLLSCANLLISLLLLKNDTGFFRKIIFSFAFLLCLGCFFLSGKIQKQTLAMQWHKKNILSYNNSAFGNIVALKEKNQHTIFYDGLPILNLPAGDIFFVEDFIHIPMLLNPDAQSILFIGHAAGGLLQEALKYPKTTITYCEIDPLFIKTLLGLNIKQMRDELNNPRVHTQFIDGRSFIKTTNHKYDIIFINAGMPTSLSINRYYTREFLTEVRHALNPKGLAIFKTSGTLVYLSNEFKAINAVVYKTIQEAFGFLEVIPGDGFNLFIASNKKQNIDTSAMMKNYHNSGIKTNLINTNYLNFRLSPTYQQWFLDNIKPELNITAANRDLKPAGIYTALASYYAQFSKQIPNLLKLFEKIKSYHFILSILALFVFLRWLRRYKNNTLIALNITALTSGLFAMSTQIMALLLFQSLLGILFQWLAILTASFMAGISAGTLIADKRLKSFASLKIVGLMECLLPVAIALLTLITALLFNNGCHPNALKGLFSLLSFSAGALIGLEIPAIFALIKKYTPQDKPPHVSAGHLYSLDLTGACIGALITPLILIPNCGIITTILILCMLKIMNGLNLFLLNR